MTLYCPKCGYARPSKGECKRCSTPVSWEDTEPPDPEIMIRALRTTWRSLLALWAGLAVLELAMLGWLVAQPLLPKYMAGSVVSSALAGGMAIVAVLAVLAPTFAWVCPCCGHKLAERVEEPGLLASFQQDSHDRYRERTIWSPESCPTCNVRLA